EHAGAEAEHVAIIVDLGALAQEARAADLDIVTEVVEVVRVGYILYVDAGVPVFAEVLPVVVAPRVAVVAVDVVARQDLGTHDAVVALAEITVLADHLHAAVRQVAHVHGRVHVRRDVDVVRDLDNGPGAVAGADGREQEAGLAL